MERLLAILDCLPRRFWYRRECGLVLFLLGVLIGLWYVSAHEGQPLTYLGFSLALGLGAIVLVVWRVLTRWPTVPRGKVGILLAIASDEEAEDRRIRADLIQELSKLLATTPKASYFHVIKLSGYFCDVAAVEGRPEDVLRKTRGHLLLYGTARCRQVNEKQTHILRLEGAVIHAPIPTEASREFGQEIGNALPRRMQVPSDGDVFAFETTSQWMNVSARYILGTAALVSGDLVLAETLYLEVERLLRNASTLETVLQPIAARLPKRILTLYQVQLDLAYNNYFMSRDKEALIIVDRCARKVLARDPDNYLALLSRGVCVFVLDRDVEEAMRLTDRCSGSKDATWILNKAFLLAYRGDLDAAHEAYRTAARGTIGNPSVPIQSEEFINIVLQEEPKKSELNFCLGLINYNFKSDYEIAEAEFRQFLESDVSDRYPGASAVAEKLMNRSRERKSELAPLDRAFGECG